MGQRRAVMPLISTSRGDATESAIEADEVVASTLSKDTHGGGAIGGADGREVALLSGTRPVLKTGAVADAPPAR